jgi:hypothetical protein
MNRRNLRQRIKQLKLQIVYDQNGYASSKRVNNFMEEVISILLDLENEVFHL